MSEQFKDITSSEVARNVSRIKRINFALKENGSVSLGGWEDDGMLLYQMAQTTDESSWRGHTDYEKAVVYQLKSQVTEEKIRRATEPAEIAVDAKESAALRLGHEALRDGLFRLQLLEEKRQKLAIPLGVQAAFHFMHADISNAADRELYSREPPIAALVKKIRSDAPYRRIRYMLPIEPDEEMDMVSSVYGVVDFEPDQAIVERLGLDPESSVPPWWQELHRDMARIDMATEKLNKH